MWDNAIRLGNDSEQPPDGFAVWHRPNPDTEWEVAPLVFFGSQPHPMGWATKIYLHPSISQSDEFIATVQVGELWSEYSEVMRLVPEPNTAGLVVGALILAALTRRKRGMTC